ncbi:unnamed protein product [Chrysodeixis includens]|uniref:Peptidase S1 domain-containing protein n=1 Tax=Chrysodeixis includens TaxID=689277 RepID=A0A9N8KV23_CHRIL|nr:unnamed protein product [Chrysodeixis includens]
MPFARCRLGIQTKRELTRRAGSKLDGESSRWVHEVMLCAAVYRYPDADDVAQWFKFSASALPAETGTQSGYTDAEVGQFPFAVTLRRLLGPQLCGGVLVSLQHVLTSASCLHETKADGSQGVIDTTGYMIIAGGNNVNNVVDGDRIRLVESYTVHPDYQAGPAHLNDIAIIRLMNPFTSTINLQALSLPAISESAEESGTACTLSGWVQGVDGNVDPVLKFATKTFLAQSTCSVVPTTPAPSTTMTTQSTTEAPSSTSESAPGDNEGGDNLPGDNEGGDNLPGDNEGGDNLPGDNEGGDNQQGDNQQGDNQQGGQSPQFFDEAAAIPTTVCVPATAGCAVLDGSPLVCDQRLVGILFYSNQCAATTHPEVFARVSQYSKWISEVTDWERRRMYAAPQCIALNKTYRIISGCLNPTLLNKFSLWLALLYLTLEEKSHARSQKTSRNQTHDIGHPLCNTKAYTRLDLRAKRATSDVHWLQTKLQLKLGARSGQISIYHLPLCPTSETSAAWNSLQWPVWKAFNRLRIQVGRCKQNMAILGIQTSLTSS